MTEKKNKAVILHQSASDPEFIHTKTIEYNTVFSFMETNELMMFMVNQTPIWVIPKRLFVSLELEYETNPDDAPTDQAHPGDGVIKFPKH